MPRVDNTDKARAAWKPTKATGLSMAVRAEELHRAARRVLLEEEGSP